MAAKTLVSWKPGKTGFYNQYSMTTADWKGLGLEDEEDVTDVVFNVGNNFTVVADKLSGAQLEFFKENEAFNVRDLEGTTTKPSARQANTQAILAGSVVAPPRAVEAGGQEDEETPETSTPEVSEDDEDEETPSVPAGDPSPATPSASSGFRSSDSPA